MVEKPSPGRDDAWDEPRARFARIARLFEATRELPPGERTAYLDREAPPELREEVQRLLDLDADDGGPIRADGAPFEPQDLLEALAEREPRSVDLPETIGPYRTLGLLGRGGMGAVYEAVRTDYDQRVAIKILRADRHDEDLLRRFRSERRILAQLEHPNVARLLDGGTLDDGRPYVVMEFVEGQDLLAFANGKELGTRERVALFRKVCGAVEHAHKNLIVHRDLKPSNILVHQDGEPKLLDFGIAKLLGPDTQEHTLAVTGTGHLLLTPEYASPEQVRGEAITTATDVYALGVVLYELLTGVNPQAPRTLRPLELERAICEQEPAPPSQRTGRGEPATEPLGATASPTHHGQDRSAGSTVTRRLRETRLRRELAGDLDTIVLAALRKEPARRYGSVGALDEDLRRYLEGLPVLARPDTFRYRSGKFVRRHRWSLSVAALMLSLVIGFAVTMAIQARVLQRQRDIALTETRVAEEVVDFLVRLFEISEPGEARGNQVRARDLLDRGSAQVAYELSSGPAVRARLMNSMGRAYHALGLIERAAPLLEDALDVHRYAGGSFAQEASMVVGLSLVRQAEGRFQEAEAMLRPVYERALEEEVDEITRSRVRLGLASVQWQLGRFEEAEELTRAARTELVEKRGEQDIEVSRASSLLARILHEYGRYEEALAEYGEALEIQVSTQGLDHPGVAELCRQRGNLLRQMGRLDEAEGDLREALRIDRATAGDEHPDVDSDLYYLASVMHDRGHFTEAEELFREVLARDEERLGHHVYVAIDYNELARTVSELGRLEEALELQEKALEMQLDLLPEDHPELATTLGNIGVTFHRMHRNEDALEVLQDSLDRRLAIYPADSPTVLTSRQLLAVVMSDEGRLEEAEEQFREVLELRRATLGEHPMVGGSLYSLAQNLNAQGRAEEAEEYLQESLRVYRATLPEGHVDTARPARLLGVLLMQSDRLEEARALLEESVDSRLARMGPEHSLTARSRRALADCLRRSGEYELAEPHYRAALEVYRAADGQQSTVQAMKEELAETLVALGREEEARQLRDGLDSE